MNLTKTFLPFFFLISSFSQAKVVYINLHATASIQDGKTWATAYKSVKIGMESASSGDQVWVTKDTYPVRYQDAKDTTEKIILQSSITVYGGFLGNETLLSQRTNQKTTISGKSFDNTIPSLSKNLVWVKSNIQVAFDQVIFSNSNSSNITASDKAGAFLVDSSSSVHFYRCYFLSNTAKNQVSCINSKANSIISLDSCQFLQNQDAYAMVYGFDNSKLEMNNCVVTSNGLLVPVHYFYINGFTNFSKGSALDTIIQMNKVSVFNNDLNFVQRDRGSTVFKNSTFDMGNGTAIYTGGDTVNFTWVENCTFTGTPVNYMIYNYQNNLIIRHSVFDGKNKAYTSGYVYAYSKISLFGSIFQNLSYNIIYAYPNSPWSGAIIDSCQFLHNTYQSFYYNFYSLKLHNCQFANNDLTNTPNGLLYFYGKKLWVSKCSFVDNKLTNGNNILYKSAVDSTFIDSSVFQQNTTDYGSLLVVDSKEYLKVNSSQFLQNSSSSSFMPTGQIYTSYGGTLRSTGNLYKDNHCVGDGSSGVAFVQGKATFLNDIFDANSGDTVGVISNIGVLDVSNCDFLNNGNGSPTFVNSSSFGSLGQVHFYNSILLDPSAVKYRNTNGQVQFSHCFSDILLPGPNIANANPAVNTEYFPINSKLVDEGTTPPDSLHLPLKDFLGAQRTVHLLDIGAVEHSISTGLDYFTNEKESFISPNPVISSYATLHSTLPITYVEVWDTKGSKTNLLPITGTNLLNFGFLENGIYVVNMHTENGSFTQKILINK